MGIVGDLGSKLGFGGSSGNTQFAEREKSAYITNSGRERLQNHAGADDETAILSKLSQHNGAKPAELAQYTGIGLNKVRHILGNCYDEGWVQSGKSYGA